MDFIWAADWHAQKAHTFEVWWCFSLILYPLSMNWIRNNYTDFCSENLKLHGFLMILPPPYKVTQVARILSYKDFLWSQKRCISRPYFIFLGILCCIQFFFNSSKKSLIVIKLLIHCCLSASCTSKNNPTWLLLLQKRPLWHWWVLQQEGTRLSKVKNFCFFRLTQGRFIYKIAISLKSYSPTVTHDKIFVYDFCVLVSKHDLLPFLSCRTRNPG